MNYSRSKRQSPDGSAPTSVPTLPSGAGLRSQSSRRAPRTMRAVQLANQRPDTAADIAWRKKNNAALAQAGTECTAKFGRFTEANAEEALAWREARWAELMR